MSTIAILGSGVMGSALAVPLADNGHDVRLVGTFLDAEIIDSIKATGIHPGLRRRLPASVRPFQLEEVEAAFEGAEIVLSGVNSFGVHSAGQQLAPLLEPGMLVIAIAKGMEAADNGDLRILPDVLAEEVPENLRSQVSWAAIGARRSPARWPQPTAQCGHTERAIRPAVPVRLHGDGARGHGRRPAA